MTVSVDGGESHAEEAEESAESENAIWIANVRSVTGNAGDEICGVVCANESVWVVSGIDGEGSGSQRESAYGWEVENVRTDGRGAINSCLY